MKELYKELLKSVNQLPGFGVALVLVTLVYTHARGGREEVSALETLILAVMCYFCYRIGGAMDGWFDRFYAPERRRPARLAAARDQAAKALFSRINVSVVDFDSACSARFVGEDGSHGLYVPARALARHCKAWNESIGPWEEYSKAARTLAVVALVFLLVVVTRSHEENVARAMHELQIFAQPIVLIAFLIMFVLVYVALRIQHMIRLYEFVGCSVQHVNLSNGVGAVIIEVTFPR